MRFGLWRGVALGLALAAGCAASARADHHTIPRLVPAVDVNTGGPYYMPPVPYGHYAGKDIHGAFAKHLGCLTCGGLFGHLRGCNGGGGCGLFGHKDGCGGGDACGAGGCGLFSGHGGGCGDGACGAGASGLCGGRHRLFGGHGKGGAVVCEPTVASSPQAIGPVPSAQCGEPGCGLGGKHFHGGRGRGLGLGHRGGDACGGCGGNGCGMCGGSGLFGGLGSKHGGGCGMCGGRGCGACLGALKGKALGLVAKLCGKHKIEYFWGARRARPLTPGYVPYVVTTRSPRDYFAFPPFSTLDP